MLNKRWGQVLIGVAGLILLSGCATREEISEKGSYLLPQTEILAESYGETEAGCARHCRSTGFG